MSRSDDVNFQTMEESFAVAKGVSPCLSDRGEEGAHGKAVAESVSMSLKGMETIMSLDR